jgi:hypothetical protein
VLRLLAINAIAGLALGLGVTLAILGLDTGHLRTLVAGDRDAVAPLLLLAGGFVITCASVMMGSAIMLMPKGEEDRGQPPSGMPVPVRAEVRRRMPPC